MRGLRPIDSKEKYEYAGGCRSCVERLWLARGLPVVEPEEVV